MSWIVAPEGPCSVLSSQRAGYKVIVIQLQQIQLEYSKTVKKMFRQY